MSGDGTAEKLKRAALTRFVDVGFGSTTVDDIAAGAGVGVATFYRRWPDKAALANELMVDYFESFAAVMEPVEGGTRKSRFLALWHRLWDAAQADPELLIFVEAQAHAGFMTDEVADRKMAAFHDWLKVIGDFGVEADPAVAGAMVSGTLTAMWRAGLQLDRDDLGERLWMALRSA